MQKQKSIVKGKKPTLVKATGNNKKEKNIRDQKAEEMVYSGNVARVVPRELVYLVGSQSNPSRKYEVKVVDLNEYSCTCPDFEIRSEIDKDHKCKHIRLVILLEEFSQIKQTLENDKYDF